jgi:phosphoribosylamine--glycine ligase
MAKNAELVPVSVDETAKIVDFAVKQRVDLTVVGPEAPLAAGLTDDLEKHGLLVCGPSRAAAQLEGSKVFTKNILAKYGIPTADFRVFDSYDDAEQYVLTHRLPVVIKADGLAAGKGVAVAGTYEEAVEFLRDVMETRGNGWSSRSASRARRRPTSCSPTGRRSFPCRPPRTTSGSATATRGRTPAEWAPTPPRRY